MRQQLRGVSFTENAYELKESNIKAGNDHVADLARYLLSLRIAYVKRELNPRLWGGATGAQDPLGDTQPDQRVLSEQGYGVVTAPPPSAMMRRRLALVGKHRQRP